MKVNDVLRKKEVAFRVLAMKDDYCFCINCKTDFMPAWMPISTLNEYTPDIAPLIDINMTARQKQVAHERFTMIAPMLAFLTDDKERNRIMNRTTFLRSWYSLLKSLAWTRCRRFTNFSMTTMNTSQVLKTR